MKRTTRLDLARQAPARYAALNDGRHGVDNSTTTQRLLDFLVAPDFSANGVDSIVGNPALTRLHCDACLTDAEVAVQFNMGSRLVTLCAKCCRTADQLANG